MNPESILLITGILLLLLALIDSFRKSANGDFINGKLRVFLAIVGVSLIVYSGYAFDTAGVSAQIEQVQTSTVRDIEYPVKKVQVVSPIAGDEVGCRMLTKGVYPEGHDKDIWVLLMPSDEKFYPQSDHTNTSYKENGEWQVITRYGGDEGESFEVVVYEADAAASAFFSKTIVDWNAAGEFPGLEPNELPEGINEVDRIQVTLGKDCRGANL
jgi:hypothetical protein